MKNTMAIALVMFGVVTTAQAQQKSDLDAYLDSIRAAHISEMGRSQILMVAGICAGASVLDYQKDEASGRYWPRYMSATCPKPDSDPPQIEQWKKARLSDTDRLIEKLKPFADTDGSGFVTTREADDFRWLVEFGYLVNQVNRDEGTSAALIERASGYDSKQVAEKIKAYAALAGKIHDAGVTELPKVSMTAD